MKRMDIVFLNIFGSGNPMESLRPVSVLLQTELSSLILARRFPPLYGPWLFFVHHHMKKKKQVSPPGNSCLLSGLISALKRGLSASCNCYHVIPAHHGAED
jgi:hypothetical protein